MVGNSSARRSQRKLASPERVGRFARGKAWDRCRTELRNQWLLYLSVVLLPTIVSLPAMWLAHGREKWLLLGAFISSGPWIAILMVILMSGAASILMGVYAEDWTAQSVRSLRKKGWHLTNGLQLRPHRDIDHIVVGPPGVFVIETKWSAEAWPNQRDGADFMTTSLNNAVEQISENRWDVSKHFARVIAGAPVRAVCVLWTGDSNSGDEDPWENGDVTVVPGSRLQSWLLALDKVEINEDHAQQIIAEVQKHVSGRDKYDANRGVVYQASVRRVVTNYVLPPILAAVVAFYGSVLLVRLVENWQVSVAVMAAALVAGILTLRSSKVRASNRIWLRPALWGWTFASSAIVILYGEIVVRALLS
jgi:hypothetical protein